MKKLLITIATIISLSFWLTACYNTTTKAPDTPKNTPKAPINSLVDCTTAGGEWKKVGLAGNLACVLKTKDAGKSCTDSSQCEERCLAGIDQADSAKTAGQCQATNQPFGCFAEIKDGVAEPALCID